MLQTVLITRVKRGGASYPVESTGVAPEEGQKQQFISICCTLHPPYPRAKNNSFLEDKK